MKEKEIKEIEIKALGFVEIKKEIETSFQSMEDIEKIVAFNKQNNYDYAITNGTDNTLLGCETICYLTNNDYVITSKYTDKKVVFKHKKLVEREQQEREQIKEIRGY